MGWIMGKKMKGRLRVPNLQKILTDSRFLSEAVEEERVEKRGEVLYPQSKANKYTRTNMNMHFFNVNPFFLSMFLKLLSIFLKKYWVLGSSLLFMKAL